MNTRAHLRIEALERRLLFALDIAAAEVVIQDPPGEMVRGESSYRQFLVHFNDERGADAAQYRALIDWGDGQSSIGQVHVWDSGDITGSVFGFPSYERGGVYEVSVTVQRLTNGEQIESSDSTSFSLDYQMQPIHAWGSEHAVWPIGGVVKGTPAYFTPLDDITEYTAQIDWGDGTGSAAEITLGEDNWGQPRAYVTGGEHQFTAAGEFTVTVTIMHPAREAAAFTYKVVVSDTPFATGWDVPQFYMPVSGSALTESPTVWIGNVFDRDVQPEDAYTLIVDWGDGMTRHGRVTTFPLLNASVMLHAPRHEYAQAGTYTVTYTLSRADVNDSSQIQSFTGEASVIVVPIEQWDEVRRDIVFLAQSNDERAMIDDLPAVTEAAPAAAEGDAAVNWGQASSSELLSPSYQSFADDFFSDDEITDLDEHV